MEEVYIQIYGVFSVIINGITLCYLDKDIDTGDIIVQKKINFKSDKITLKNLG